MVQGLEPLLSELREQFRAFDEALQLQIEPYRAAMAEWAAKERAYYRVYDAGWLPHNTTPLHLISESDDAPQIRDKLKAHYGADWDVVRTELEGELAGYALDDEAKQCFREALDAHEVRRYRAPPKLLFPEIERVVREELYSDNFPKLASQHDLIEAAGTLMPFELRKNAIGGLKLFRKLTSHLYVRVETPDALARAKADPVPNRHAALHGLVVYASMQSSLNALIMADFVFSIVHVLKLRGPDWRKS